MDADHVNVVGSVLVTSVLDKSGAEVDPKSILVSGDAELGNNLVVDGGRVAIAKLIGGVTTGNLITRVSFGTGDDPPRYNDVTLSPQPGGVYVGGENQVELSPGVFDKAISGISFPGQYLVRFEFSLGYAEANGLIIREVGLWTSGGELFARKSFPGIIKSADNSIQLAWLIRC